VRYCIECGGGLEERVPPGEDRLRLVCGSCGHISYMNPKVVVGILPIRRGAVLLLRRAIEPRFGAWTCPGGFLELGETAEDGARREAREELGIEVGDLKLLGVYSRPRGGVVVIVYTANLVGDEVRLGPEALETAFFGPDAVPWEELAFPTTASALEDWVSLCENGLLNGRADTASR
jgi:ADP-ribose pyrophosphatase YjhB (NUDIX family)